VNMQVEPLVTSGAGPADPLKKSAVDRELVARLVGDAQRDGVAIDGEGGLLAELTRLVLESALEGELTAHLGYEKHERVEDRDGNARNGTRAKTVLSRPARSRSRSRGIGPGRSSPRSCGSGNAGWARSRTSCSRSPPVG
jgi:hypothetical protein